MSNMKELDEEEHIIKNVPVIYKDELGKDPPSKKKYLYYGLIIGGILILIAIVIIIIVALNKSPTAEINKTNTLKAKYYTDGDEISVKLFSYTIKNSYISSMKIDNKNI